MSDALPDPSTHLQPPSKTIEKEDPGAEDHIASDSDEEHFSDASEGHSNLQTKSPQSGRASPVPRTRVQRVDDSAQHGEVPGTEAYEKRGQDAVPDEIEVVPEVSPSRDPSPAGSQDRPLAPGGSPIPRTVVEKVDPESPSHGEVPGTEAYEKRQADAVPDVVTKASDDLDSVLPPPVADRESPDSSASNSSNQSIPETRLSRVDTIPAEDELPSPPRAHQRSPSDAVPDTVENISDSPPPDHGEEHNFEGADDEDDFGDDFDEFVEEQGGMGDDDFGDFDDFDDGFQEPEVIEDAATAGSTIPQQPPVSISVPPLIDFDNFNSTSELLTALQGTLDSLLPAAQDLSSLPPVEPIPDASAIFSTERSLSLWSQLVAPPPLQPQNWVKSRIRRLFLVSLGVPVDLDEILPASKQKKLVLPSIDLDNSGTTTPFHNQSRKEDDDSATTGQAPTRSKTTRRGAAPAPELDLPSVRRLCATTDAALNGLTDSELTLHVSELEQVTLRASAVLEYWLKRRDGLVSEKEAFEGVIENLVSHVRRVRK
ncbi:uncharacterized protein N7473_007526 [Penicillium subrubescens]|uniref:Uncharacterized protein n=1 Tax=Penicillium subrubescens TaxID=1316194 RepID=A0A1Q5SS79_9EURO|nr:uncharacterized protein N7473_007526 [Penicillium subrubescens]KAJ5891298.1 hypothetical protein N7473_007526 [Penicillium subrubescens]OKO90867.1 hypothetical protein PENSUB_13168 [Penicillium subrubescens]